MQYFFFNSQSSLGMQQMHIQYYNKDTLWQG